MEEVRYTNLGEWVVALEVRKDHDLQAVVYPKRRIFGFLDHTESRFHCISVRDRDITQSQVQPQVYKALCTFEAGRQLIEGG